MRHVIGLPTVQIIRQEDKSQFDVSQGRTIIIDTADRYTIMDRFESARNELRKHVKATLSAGKELQDNPIQYYLPTLRVTVPPRE